MINTNYQAIKISDNSLFACVSIGDGIVIETTTDTG
jgi:hypothetical protein